MDCSENVVTFRFYSRILRVRYILNFANEHKLRFFM